MDDDIRIVQRVQAGDTEAFSLLVSRYHRNLLNFIYRLVRDESLVEDLGQEVFLNAFRGLRDFDPERGVPFGAWLFTLARNRCVSQIRRTAARDFVDLDGIPGLAAATPDAEAIILAEEQRDALHRSLAQLAEPYRETILHSLAGKTLAEIAQMQQVAPGTVKSRLSRAKERVGAYMGLITKGESNERI